VDAQTMQATMTTLKQSSEAGTHQLSGIANSACQLAEGIAAARMGFHAGTLFAETVPLCLEHLHAIATCNDADLV
jgi:hypothetical protein